MLCSFYHIYHIDGHERQQGLFRERARIRNEKSRVKNEKEQGQFIRLSFYIFNSAFNYYLRHPRHQPGDSPHDNNNFGVTKGVLSQPTNKKADGTEKSSQDNAAERFILGKNVLISLPTYTKQRPEEKK